jgi:hypothetical protein
VAAALTGWRLPGTDTGTGILAWDFARIGCWFFGEFLDSLAWTACRHLLLFAVYGGRLAEQIFDTG